MNTPDQLDIVQQMNKLLQEQNKILSQLAGAMGQQAQAAQQATEGNNKVADSAKTAADQTKELTEAMKENTGGASALGDALGVQAGKAKEAETTQKKLGDTVGKSVAVMGALSAAVAGVANAFEAANGAFNLFTGVFSSGLGILKGGIGIIGGFFSGLMSTAADYANQASQAWHQANESIRKDIGDIHSDQGKFVKDLMGNLDSAKSALAASGTSLRSTIGQSHEVLKELHAMAMDFGDSMVAMQDQINGATSEMLLMRKGMNMSGEAFKQMASAANASGGTMQEALTETMVASSHLSKTFGVDVKVIGKNIDKMAKDVGSFGSLAPKQLAAVATYASKLGVSIESLKGTMTAFDTFESAAQNAGKLAEAFGMNIDAMAMMNEENPAKRMDMLRESFEATGKSVADLSRHELKMLSDSMGGMPVDELKNALSMSTDEMGFGDFEDAAEEAAQKITPEEAMADVADSMDRLAAKLDKLTGGPLSNFIAGFMKVLNRSPEMRELLTLVGKWLKEFFKAGEAVGHMFLEFIRGPGSGMFDTLKSIFDIKRIQAFLGVVKEAFSEFFALLKTDPKQAVENLFDKIFGAFEDWFSSGPSTSNLATMLGKLIENALLIVAGLAPKIIKTAAKYITQFAQALGDFLNGDNDTANAIGGGIGGAFMLAFDSIKDALINDLLPSLLDLFGTLFAKFGPPIMAILTVVWTAIFVKSVVSAAMAAAAGAALQAGIKFLGDKILGMMSAAGGGEKVDKAQAQKAAAITEGIAESMESVLKAFRKIKKSDIKKAGEILLQMAIHMVKGMIALAAGMVVVSAILSVVPFMALIKGILGLTAATMNSVMMVGAAFAFDKAAKAMGGPGKVSMALIKLAAIMTVGGVAMAIAGAIFGAAWSMVPMGPLLLGVLAMNALIIGSIPMLLAAAVLGLALTGPQLGALFAGIGYLALVLVAAAAMAIPAMVFAFAWSKIDIMGILKGVTALNMLVIGVVPMILVAVGLGALLIWALAPTIVGLVALGVLMSQMHNVTPLFKNGADSLVKDLGSVNIAKFTKSISILSSLALVAPLMVAAGLVMFALSGGMVFALVGLYNMGGFIEGASSMIADAIQSLTQITISDPKKTEGVLNVVTKVIEAVSKLASLGMQAMGMAIAGGVIGFFSGSSPADMMKSMSNFVLDILGESGGGGIIGAVEIMVGLAGKFDQNALKGAEALAGIIAAIAQLAGALIEPLTAMSANAGNWYGGGKAEDMKAMVSAVGEGVGDILKALKEHLIGPDGLIESLLGVFNSPALQKEKPETLKARADTLKSLFEAVLAIVNAVSEMQKFEKEGNWLGNGAESAKDVITDMLKTATEIIGGTEMSNLVDKSIALMAKIGDPEGIKAQAEAMRGVVGGVVEIVKAMGDLGKYLSDGGAQGLFDLKFYLEDMEKQEYLPSMVINKIVDESVKISAALNKMKVDFGKADIKQMKDGILGFEGEHKVVIAPEAVNLTVKLNVVMSAEDVAVAIVKGTKTKYDGFFQTTQQVDSSDLDLAPS